MAFDGNGTFTRLYNWVTDRDGGIKIRADRMDAEMDGFKGGFDLAFLRDGRAAATDDWSMGGFKIENLAAPSANNDAARKKYVDDAIAALSSVYEAKDATLTAFAGQTTAANKLWYWTGVDAGATTDLTAFGRGLIGAANLTAFVTALGGASAARTALGVAIGSDVQAFSSDLSTYAANPLTSAELGQLQNIDSVTLSNTQWGYLGASTATGGALMGAANAAAALTTLGAYSSAATDALLAAKAPINNATLTGLTSMANGLGVRFSNWTASNTDIDGLIGGSTSGALIQGPVSSHMTFALRENDTAEAWSWISGGGNYDVDSTYDTLAMNLNCTGALFIAGVLDIGGNGNSTIANSGSGRISVEGVEVTLNTATQTLTNKTFTSPTINGGTSSASLPTSGETSGTLTTASRNAIIFATGNITVPASVFAAANVIVIYAGASARTLTQGSGGTQRLHGTSTTGNLTIAARGVAVVIFISATEWVVMGDVS